MAEQWHLKGEELTACNCNSPCPCTFGQDPTKGYCQANLVMNFTEGNYGSVDLSGRRAGIVLAFEGNVFSGDITVGFLVDEDATDEQLEALETILTGKAGGVFENLAGLYGTVKGVKRAPIEVGDGDRPRFSIGPTEVEVEHLTGADEESPVVVMNSPFDFSGEGLQAGRTEGRFADEEWGFSFDDFVYAHSARIDAGS